MHPEFALMETILARDPATYLHSQRTASYADLLCMELGVDPAHTGRIRTAALLHDIGKIGIPDAILKKPGPLTPAEWEVVRTHSAIGASIIESAGLYKISRWVYHLHERFDGRGYPDGLAGDTTPFESRLLHAADSLDAMTAERPYSPPLTLDAARGALEQCAGTQLDPAVVLPLAAAIDTRRRRFARADGSEPDGRGTLRRRLSLRPARPVANPSAGMATIDVA